MGDTKTENRFDGVQKAAGHWNFAHTSPPVITHRLQTALLLLPLKTHPALSRPYALAPGGLTHTTPQPLHCQLSWEMCIHARRCDTFVVSSLSTEPPSTSSHVHEL